ncbi:MAG: flagellin [Caulobacteraceae bacterium]|nr:flagellin [Caulobacteraceae bacterium]
MPLNSVNTNVGAMVALQNLNRTNTDLQTVQSRINTGLKINSAKDNGAIWAIAQNQRAESSSLNAVMSSLQRGQSVADVAMAAGTAISDILVQMKEKAVASTEAGLTTASLNALNDEYTALRDQINTIANNATFDGVNLIAAVATNSSDIKAIANADASATIDIDHQDLSLTNSSIALVSSDISSGAATADITEIETAIQAVSTALSAIGTGAKALDTHLNFIGKLQDTLDSGIGNLVDADLAKESARLQALQVKQQLGIQALSIANQSSSALLGLFR